jgi:predicted ATPase
MPADTLHDITIRGFKSIASIEKLKLNPINIVIGANGSGKSNFIGAFAFLREVGVGRLRDYVKNAGGADKVLHFGSKTTERIDVGITSNYGGYGGHPSPSAYNLTLLASADDGLFPSREELHLSAYPPTSLGEYQRELEAGIGNPASEGVTKGLRQTLDLWRVYHLHDTSYMRKAANIHDKRFLRADGSNLPAFLYDLREKWPDYYNLIVAAVQQVSPFFDNFDLNPDGNSGSIQLVWRHRKSDQFFNASSLSDGTLRFIALATLFLQPEMYRRSLVLVDEPELGLHPYAIELLASLIHRASVNTQVIVSTQSSLLLDHFEPKDILVADRVDGGTQLTRPDSERLEKWLEDYSLGQLWEKNELGGRPAPV